jgi:hypothetical protein
VIDPAPPHPLISSDAPRAAARSIMGRRLPGQDLLSRRMGQNRISASAGPARNQGLRFMAECVGAVIVSLDVTDPLDSVTDCGEKLQVIPACPEMLSATAVEKSEPVGAIVIV